MDLSAPISLKTSVDSTYPSVTSNPLSSETNSIFGEKSCGEPLVTQHLVIDFTPKEDTDNDYVQRKCCAFWEFISRQPLLQKLRALPESNEYRKNLESSGSIVMNEISEPIIRERTAVSMLEIVEDKGLIDRTFEAKLVQSLCTLGSREYHENETTSAMAITSKEVCIGCGSCISCSLPSEGPSATPGVVDLCKKMQEWDDKHPKSMEPPGHPPTHSRCAMQRNMIS